MTTLKEVIAEPFTVFRRDFAGSALPTIPAVNRTPTQLVSDGWELLGARGRNSVKREGVRVASTPTFQKYMGAAAIKTQDMWITGDEAMIEFSLVDVSMALKALVLHQTVTTAGSGATKYDEVGFGHPIDLVRHSWLFIGRSPDNLGKSTARNRFFLVWDGVITSGLDEQPNLDAPGETPFKIEPMAVDDTLQSDESKKYGLIRSWAA